jgi:hypothetical protein
MCPRSHRQLWTLGEDCLYAKVNKIISSKKMKDKFWF